MMVIYWRTWEIHVKVCLEDILEKEMATHSSILAWRIQWTGEPGGLQSMGSQRGSVTERNTANEV